MEPIYGGNLGRQIMVFKPTMDEFKNFSGYIEYMESMGAHKAGIAKIIPPREWVPRRMGYDDIDMLIKAPIEQSVQGIKGLYTQYNIQRKAMTVKEFAAMAKSSKYAPPAGANFEELERKYWRNITFNPPYYGADVSGTLTDPDQPYWNIGKLGTILDCLTDEYKVKIEGVNTAYLYFGMWKATFPWHTEDMDLYSINYIHFGAPKSWYAVPPEHGRRLERLATSFFPASAATCKAFLRHKMNIISPSILHQYSVPVNKITQEAGQFIVTFPYGYHAGYNHGYNAAESTNFASERWIEYGKRCSRCVCNRDSVRIKMDVFVKRYQPDRYDAWLAGTDVRPHPEDDTSKLYPTRHQTSTAAADADSRKRKIAVNEEGCMSTKRHPPASSFTTSVPAPANMKQARVVIRPLSVSDMTSSTAAKLAGQVVRSVSRNSQSTTDDEIEEILPNYHVPLEERVKMRHTKAPFIVLKPIMQHETSSPASIVTLSDSSDSSVDQQVATRKAAKSKACRCRGGYVDGPACCLSTDESSQSPSLAEVDVRCCAENNGETTVTKTCSHNPCNACCVDNSTSASKMSTTTAYTTSHASVLQALNACLKREQVRQQYPSLACAPSSADNSVMANGNLVTESNITQSLDAERQAVTSYLSASTNQMLPKLSASLPSVTSHPVQLDTGNSAAVPFNDLSLFDCYQTADGQLVLVPKANISDNKLTVEHDSPLINGASNGHLSYDLNGQLYVSSSVEEVVCDSVPVVCDEVTVDSAGDTHPAGTDDLLYKGLRPLGQGQVPTGDAENECEGRMSQQHRAGVEHGLYSRKQTSNKRKKQANSGMLSAVVKSSLGELRIDEKRMARCSEELRTLVLGDGEEEIAAYNRRCALAPPHCAVCSLFTPPAQRCVPTSSPPPPLPASSRPVANHLCFATSSAMLPEEVGSCVGMDATGASCLFTCQRCAVCVHASCYGSSACAENWLCDACIALHIGRELPRPRCCLCVMRGGPLKCTSDGRWAHITCVIGLPDVSFVNIATRQPVCIDNIDPARTTLRCCYCHQVSGVCVQCSQKKCFSSFHVTCGALSGVTFETWDWPYPVYITCHRHAAHSSQQAANKQDPLPVGCKVVAKQKNGLYGHAVVTGVTTATCCNIDFEDGTYSNNMRLEDIESHNIVRDGAPESGTIVQARWVDGLLYSATFNSITDVITYKVQFADSGAQLSVRHEDTWPAKLPLPVQVQAKLAQPLS